VTTSWICITCGVQYPPSAAPPDRCPICEDPRQYVGWNGQAWTSLPELQSGHTNTISEEEPGLYSILTTPAFGINQRAFLIRTPDGNVLWDCIALLDQHTEETIHDLGGIQAIAISHPHYYSTMAEWSRTFGDAPVYIHELDREWVQRPDNVVFWSGNSHSLGDGVTLVHSGGHFDGFQVLSWQAGAGGKGVLMAGDQPQVAMDRKSVSFLWSYPNMIPLGPAAVRKIVESLEPWEFDRLYGAFAGRTLKTRAKDTVSWSADRYLRFILPS
jgi:hypothetical protein